MPNTLTEWACWLALFITVGQLRVFILWQKMVEEMEKCTECFVCGEIAENKDSLCADCALAIFQNEWISGKWSSGSSLRADSDITRPRDPEEEWPS